MNWLEFIAGFAAGLSLCWLFLGYLVWWRIDVLWDYARSLDRSVNAHSRMIESLSIWTGFSEDQDGRGEVPTVQQNDDVECNNMPEGGPETEQARPE